MYISMEIIAIDLRCTRIYGYIIVARLDEEGGVGQAGWVRDWFVGPVDKWNG